MNEQADSDHDGLPDGWELLRAMDPTHADGDDGDYGDPDDDGFLNSGEYQADTNPTNALSLLRMTSLSVQSGGVTVVWQGGRLARQTLERTDDLSVPGVVWLPVTTNDPPTPEWTTFQHTETPPSSGFYRVRASRDAAP